MTEQRYLLVSVEQTSSSPWRSNIYWIFKDIQYRLVSVEYLLVSVEYLLVSVGICWISCPDLSSSCFYPKRMMDRTRTTKETIGTCRKFR
jgi:hypothetical protein